MKSTVALLTATVLLSMASAADAREWADIRGNKMEGELFGMSKGRVILALEKGKKAFPFSKFTEADQAFIRRQMEAKGQGHLVPDASKSGSMANSSYVPPRLPIVYSFRRPQTPIAEAMRRNPFFIPATVWAQNIRQGQIPVGYWRPPAVTGVKRCGHCKQVVHSNARVGQYCPFCGAYWVR